MWSSASPVRLHYVPPLFTRSLAGIITFIYWLKHYQVELQLQPREPQQGSPDVCSLRPGCPLKIQDLSQLLTMTAILLLFFFFKAALLVREWQEKQKLCIGIVEISRLKKCCCLYLIVLLLLLVAVVIVVVVVPSLHPWLFSFYIWRLFTTHTTYTHDTVSPLHIIQ